MVPNTKTFTGLIRSFGKTGNIGVSLDIISELPGHFKGMAASASTYAALMAACEKTGQGKLALALFEEMRAQVHAHVSYSAAVSILFLMYTPINFNTTLLMKELPVHAEHAA